MDFSLKTALVTNLSGAVMLWHSCETGGPGGGPSAAAEGRRRSGGHGAAAVLGDSGAGDTAGAPRGGAAVLGERGRERGRALRGPR